MASELSAKSDSALNSEQVIDFPQLLERCMGDQEFAERCLTRFQQRLEADVEQLQQSVNAGDTAEAARIAHLIKGSAATVAATALAESASTLECAAHQCPVNDIELVIATKVLANEVDRFTKSIPLLLEID